MLMKPAHVTEARELAAALWSKSVTAVGFEPTQLALVELESTPLDHSGKLSWVKSWLLAIICCEGWFPKMGFKFLHGCNGVVSFSIVKRRLE